VDARRDLLAQCLDRLLPGDRTAPAALGRCPALTGVHGVDVRAVEPVLEQPLRGRRPHLLAPAPFCLASLLYRDSAVDLSEGRRRLLNHHSSGEAEQLKPRRFIVPVFDCREVYH
jgi:hypothetical protein